MFYIGYIAFKHIFEKKVWSQASVLRALTDCGKKVAVDYLLLVGVQIHIRPSGRYLHVLHRVHCLQAHLRQ